MTNAFVAGFFVLLGLVGMMGVLAGLNGVAAGWLFGLPAGAVSLWFMGTRYEGTPRE